MLGYIIREHGGPEALEWGELPQPEPNATEVLVKVKACGLNHLDLWVRNGVEGHKFPLPLIPGSEITGNVAELGAPLPGVEVGDAVLIAPGVSCGRCDRCLNGEDPLCRHYGILGEHRDGGYAEYICVPRRNILPMPKGLSYAEAAALPLTFLTAWHMLVARAQLRPLEDVLIQAAGSGVSSAAIQIARLMGAGSIIATAGSDEKLEKARELGATHTINYTETDFAREVRSITNKKGVDVVVEHVGGEVFENSLKTLAWGGRVVLCGSTTGYMASINLRAVFFKAISILGSTMGSLAELQRLLRHVERGDLKPVVDRTFPFEEAAAAQETLTRREQFGKVVLTLDGAEERPE